MRKFLRANVAQPLAQTRQKVAGSPPQTLSAGSGRSTRRRAGELRCRLPPANSLQTRRRQNCSAIATAFSKAEALLTVS
jgi:hypothetical protein